MVYSPSKPGKPAQSLRARRVIGVDIDESLVRTAWKRRRTIWSQQAPLSASDNTPRNETESPNKRRKRAELLSNALRLDYFPVSCEHMSGPLPIPPQSTKTGEFPYNVTFRAADWVSAEIAEDAEGYDVVVAWVSCIQVVYLACLC